MSSSQDIHALNTPQPNIHNTQNFNLSHPKPKSNTNELQLLTLSISTHNVQGLNNNVKKEAWKHYCIQHNLDIVSLTETKLSQKSVQNKQYKTNYYTYLWSGTDSSRAGTAIMICNHLAPHIHKTTIVPGYAIAIDLLFKNDFKFRIISLYLPSSDAQHRLQVQNTIIQWIQQATANNIIPITLGDFNASTDNIHSQSIKYKLLQYLTYNNMYNLAAHSHKSASTWHRANLSSEIDYIWVYQPVLQYLTDYETDDPDTSTLSDHKILISRWLFPFAKTGQSRHKTRTKRRVFEYKLMDSEKWENFTNRVNSNLLLHHTPSDISTSETLEIRGTKFKLVSSQQHLNISLTKDLQSVTSIILLHPNLLNFTTALKN